MVLFTGYLSPIVENSDRKANKLHHCLGLHILNTIETKLMDSVPPCRQRPSTLSQIFKRLNCMVLSSVHTINPSRKWRFSKRSFQSGAI